MHTQIILVGHRGSAATEPENTIRSFDVAIKAGADAIEFDTRLTRDGKLIAFHDKDLDRTTDGTGPVREHTYGAIKKLDAGKGEAVPLARDALRFILKKKKMALVEIKDKDSVEKVAKLVKGKKNVIVHSFDSNALKKLKALAPNAMTALIVSNKISNMQGFLRLCKAIHVDWILAKKDILSKDFVATAHKWGFLVQSWVVNTLTDMKKYARMGVDMIASDKPELFKKFRRG